MNYVQIKPNIVEKLAVQNQVPFADFVLGTSPDYITCQEAALIGHAASRDPL